MSFSKALAAFFEPKNTAAAHDVRHGRFTDGSLWVLVIFGALLIWLAHGIVTEANVQRLFWAALVFMVCDTVKVVTAMIVNGMTRRSLGKQFMRDGKLDGNEASALAATAEFPLTKIRADRATSP